jgi:hypothetical protein
MFNFPLQFLLNLPLAHTRHTPFGLLPMVSVLIEEFKVLVRDNKIKLYCKAQSNLMNKVRNSNN